MTGPASAARGLAQGSQQAATASGAGPLLQRKCACGNSAVTEGKCTQCAKHDDESKDLRQYRQGMLQTRLAVGASDDPLEIEADRVADRVLTAPSQVVPGYVAPRVQRLAPQGGGSQAAPASVERTLAGGGRAMDAGLRADMEPRFGCDFSHVRVHADAAAGQSARDVNALAYTVGSHIVFGAGQWSPRTQAGRRLIAHELTHVVQQSGAAELNSNGAGRGTPDMHSGAPIVQRASPDAVGHIMTLGRVPHTGIQFWPTNVTDTRVGPVSVEGGLLSSGASRLNVIIGENLSPRLLARQLLPLWNSATPFTPPGAASPLPLDLVTEDQLAQALLCYNQTYLPVPSMTNWRAGLRFPLPVEIDETTGIATLHPLQIRALAGGFTPAWAPLLDRRAAAIAAPPAATLQADVTAFLGRETTALARGIALGARSITNAQAEQPFVHETFRQLGAASFDVALAFMDNLVNRDIGLLAAQRDGAAILGDIMAGLAAAPAAPSAAQQASRARADRMLAQVVGVVPQAPPAATRTRAEKTITIDTVKLDGSTHDPATDVAVANAILSQCNVRVRHGVNATATNAQTTGWLGGDTSLRAGNNCAAASAEERSLFQGASAAFGFSARFRAFFPATFTGVNGSGYSCIPSDSPAAMMRNTAVVQNDGDTDSLAHELGHILINLGPHTATGVMSPRPAPPAWRVDEISDAHCTRLYNNA